MKEINSRTNQYIKDLIKLKSNQENDDEKLFFIEGKNIIDQAIKDETIKEILITKEHLTKYQNYDNIILITDDIATKISDVRNNQGIFAVCHKPKYSIDFDSNTILLDDVQDPGNLGAIIRSAKSFGFKNIIRTEKSANFYNSKVVRSTQGNNVNINLINNKSDLSEIICILKENGYEVVGTFLSEKNTVGLSKYRITNKKLALIIGNEGSGIKEKYKKLIDLNIKIESNSEVESLNAAIAASILMYNVSVKK